MSDINQAAEFERNQKFTVLQQLLKEEPCNPVLYMQLGEWYESENIDQAYLTYVHARYMCRREKEKNTIPDMERDSFVAEVNKRINRLRQDARFHVHPASFIIVSFNTLSLTRKCLESIRSTCEMDEAEIVIVDNNSHDGSKEWLREQKDIVFVENDYNAGFPGGCNLGFHAASSENDMLLLNSDTEMTENAFYTLRMGLYSDRRIGMAGGFSNANYLHECSEFVPQIPGESEYYDYGRKINVPCNNMLMKRSVLFAFYVIVRRDVFNKVGEWDELYNPGNYDDHDYSYRVLKAGYQNVLCWNSFIIHRAHRSFSKNRIPHQEIMQNNYTKFSRKWGFCPDEYSNAHYDMLSLIRHGKEESFRLLFIGCGCGDALYRLEMLYPHAEVHGLEKNPAITKMGAVMASVSYCDIESMEIPYERYSFDYVMIADTLECCADPEKVLRISGEYLKGDGALICCVDSVLNAKIISDLLKGGFYRNDVGMIPSRKVNFFTNQDMRRMFDNAGYRIEFIFSIVLREISSNYDKELFGELCNVEGVVDRKQFDEHHIVFRIRKKVIGCDI